MSRSNAPFLLGADPELFMQDKSGKILSAIGKLGGTKDKPIPVEELGKGFAYQEDNVLVEYNIPAAANYEAFMLYNAHMMKFLRNKVKKEHGAGLVVQASHIMDEDQLEDPRAHVFGCEPDFNVWTLENNPKPKAVNPALRSAGGHIHIGLKMGRMDKIALARLLDATVGIWSVTVDRDTRRRELYGKAGSIRDKKYGLEYRTLSNFWVDRSDYQKIIWIKVNQAINFWKAKDFSLIDKFGGKIMTTINNSDVDSAHEILSAQ